MTPKIWPSRSSPEFLSAGLAIMLALGCVAAWAKSMPVAAEGDRQSPLKALTQCQALLADHEWSYRIWPESNPTPKPSRQAILPEGKIQERVHDLLSKEAALSSLYQETLDAPALQLEMDRMARGTRAPDRLRERFQLFGNNAEAVANCIARPLLIERRLRDAYRFDVRWHGERRRQAEAALAGSASAGVIAASGGVEETFTLVRGASLQDDHSARSAGERLVSPDEFAEQLARLGSPSGLRETTDAFIEETLLSQSADRLVVRTRVWAKQTFEDWWLNRRPAQTVAATWTQGPTLRMPEIQGKAGGDPERFADEWLPVRGSPAARAMHTAVWTGSEMIVWGGVSAETAGNRSNSGGRYDPTTDSWRSIQTSPGALPTARSLHTAVWTGSEMIIWGGSSGANNLDTGGRYNPTTDAWMATAFFGAPTARSGHTAVWTGSEMIVWGGSSLNSGARYSPATDTWTEITTIAAPSGRSGHVAVWTGSTMIVWGGSSLNSGGRYDPATDTWSPTAATGAPTARSSHVAVWTGSEMVVWGGGIFPATLNTGGRYNPIADTWTSTAISGAPSSRMRATAVWTGSEMIVWGGQTTAGTPTSTGGRYDPSSNTWNSTVESGVPIQRLDHSAVWTGTEMIIWGGSLPAPALLNSGGRYNPTTNSWTPTAVGSAPDLRGTPTAVWTGSEVIVWGGSSLASGGRYDPTTDSWTTTTMNAAPSGRQGHVAVWSGNEMIVWGGFLSDYLATGGRYNPTTNEWIALQVSGAPLARFGHTSVWTGSEMIVWGGESSTGALNTGGRYNPTTDSWTATTMAGAPESRSRHTSVWTGGEMIVWGGRSPSPLRSGGRYSPSTDSWAATDITTAPSGRYQHSAIWTGSEMIVWGGSVGSISILSSGSRYNPALDHWIATSSTGAPSGRVLHTAVWAGTEMIVWGGGAPGNFSLLGGLNTGGRYSVAANAWTPTTTNRAPGSRSSHSAVWTGNDMIVLGGCCGYFDYGVYRPNASASGNIFRDSFEGP